VLADHGQDRPAGCWSGPGRAWLADLSLPPASRRVIDDDLALIDALIEPVARLDAQISERAKTDPRVKILTTLPGVVGELTALVILAEVGDFTPVRQRRQAGGLGRADADGARLGSGGPARAHLVSRARHGCGGSCARRRRPPNGRPSPP
jgi:transposase